MGNFKAVSTVASQGLSDTEKSNARTNIGAGTGNGTYSKPSGGIPKTDLASAVQTSLEKADSALQSHQTIKQDGVTGATVNRFGTCSTAAATAAKTVSVTSGTFSLEAGARVTVKFTNANTADTPTLNVNSKGAKNIYSKGSQITTGSNKSLLAGTVDFIYDGTQWHLIGNYIDTNTTYSSKSAASGGTDVSLCTTGEKYTWNSKAAGTHTHDLSMVLNNNASPSINLSANGIYTLTAGGKTYNFKTPADNNTYPSAYCSTAAATAAKAATCTNYVLLANSYIHVLITTANTVASALTLNISGTGAKPIYINGSASSSSNYTLPAGSYLVYYNGTNYYFRTDGKITSAGIVDIGANTDLLSAYKISIYNGAAGTVQASQSYACVINHIVSVHVCTQTSKEIPAGSEGTVAFLSSSAMAYGTNYHFYPLALAFYSGTPIAGVQCYIKGYECEIKVKPLQSAIPSGTMLFINGTYLTERYFPALPT